jgi:hypothetical protein
MQNSRLKKIIGRIVEGAVAILLVLFFFSLFLGLLNTIFPTGTSLREIIARQGKPGATQSSGNSDRDLQMVYGDGELDPAASGEPAAVLNWVRNSVKSKRASEIAWQTAQEGNQLFDRDAVQTLKRSAAEIKFDENTSLNMGPQSLVIIKRISRDSLLHEKRSFMVLVDGELRGMLAPSGPDSVYLEIDTPGAKLRTHSGSGTASPVDFKLSVNDDQSSTIAVYKGTAEIMAQGKTVVVNANQSTVVGLNQTPLDPRDLPRALELKSPAGGKRFYYRDLPPKIKFAWQAHPGATAYHLVLARDPYFREIVTDDLFTGSGFSHGNLQKGVYHWKVSAMQDTIEGFFSRNGSFEVIQDQTPPKLQVQFPPSTIYQDRYTLHGRTSPGARVFVGGRRIKISGNGKFNYTLKLNPGINIIVVEAFDGVNNVAYRSQRVNRKL